MIIIIIHVWEKYGLEWDEVAASNTQLANRQKIAEAQALGQQKIVLCTYVHVCVLSLLALSRDRSRI